MATFLSTTKCVVAASLLVLLQTPTTALDIEFDKVTCDESLPAYVTEGNLQMTCNNGDDSRCTFGTTVAISGYMQYHGLSDYIVNGTNNTGYASADLNLLSVEYNLFHLLPFNFCGEWVQAGKYNSNPCPYDGSYHFNVPYDLPWDDGDITTWFATGWQGTSNLIIYSSASEDDSDLLASCILHWKTYVTQTNEEAGWKTLPSAAQVAIILASVLAFMCCCCFYLSCCRRRRRKRHVTDVDYDGTDFKMFEDEKMKEEKKKKEKDELLYKINVNMKEPDWA